MAFDPSVLSQIPDYAPNPVNAQANALSLGSAGIDYQQKKQSQMDEQEARQLLKGVDLMTPEGQAKLNQLPPELRMKMMQGVANLGSAQRQHTLEELQIADAQVDALSGALDPIVAQLETLKSQPGMTPAMLDAKAKQLVIPAALQLRKQRPDLAPTIDRFLQDSNSLTYQGIRAVDEQSKRGSQALKERLAERRQQELERENRARDIRAEEGGGTKGQHVETIVREGKPHKILFNAKGEEIQDLGETTAPGATGGLTGRESVFVGRVTASAEEASQALQNIVELPVGASTGIFGVGASPGHSIFTAGKDVLRNKVSSQEVQDYGTMLAGVRRNLATIESSGLAPSGSLTESMASIELRAGDTEYTKLRKLAEMRQILDRGLRPLLNNPRVPDETKQEIRGIVGEVEKAVPFTQHDVTRLQREHQEHPEKTIQQLMQEKQLGTSKTGQQAEGETRKFQGKTYRLKPGTDRTKKENWELVNAL